jgi:hypothetical protein
VSVAAVASSPSEVVEVESAEASNGEASDPTGASSGAKSPPQPAEATKSIATAAGPRTMTQRVFVGLGAVHLGNMMVS